MMQTRSCSPGMIVAFTGCLLGNSHPSWAAEPLDPTESERAMATHPGWTATIIAHEPLVIDPVAIRVDRKQRLWVVEMSDYPTGPKNGEAPIGRVRILEDLDRDGKYESGTTFADHLLFPTGVQPWRDGAIVTLAGQVVWMQDADGDNVADKTEVWFEGFSTGNSQLRANHPTLGPDGMVYIANGLQGGTVRAIDARFDQHVGGVDLRDRDFCFDPEGGAWRAVTGNSQFGMTIDDYGRRIGCSNRNPAMYCVLDNAAIARDTLLSPGDAIEKIGLAGEESRVTSRATAWTTSNLHAGQFSAACGVTAPGWRASSVVGSIFTSGQELGEWLLVCEPTSYLIQRQWLSQDHGVWRSVRAAQDDEFMASTDTWFRPVDITPGPNDSIYVADMYRAVIEHPDWAPVELKNRPDTWNGNDRGRIWRLSRRNASGLGPAASTGMPDAKWLAHPNPWIREMASQYFYEIKPEAIVERLRRVVVDPASSPMAIARAAQWLSARGTLDDVFIQRLVEHDDARVIELGVTLIKDTDKQLESLAKLSGGDDLTVRLAAVRFAVAAKLAAMSHVTPSAIDTLLTIARRDGEHPVMNKILGSVDACFLEDLCLASAVDVAVPGKVVSHWWSRWTVLSPTKSLISLLPKDEDTVEGRELEWRLVSLLDSWLRGNQAAGTAKLNQESIRSTLGTSRLTMLQTLTSRVAVDPKATESVRSASIRGNAALGELPKSMWMLLDDDQPAEVRLEALKVWFRQDMPTTLDWLSDELLALPPSLRSQAIQLLVSSASSTAWLFDKIETGKLRPSLIDPQIGQRLTTSKDPEIAARAKVLFTVTKDREETIARYQNASAFTGGLHLADASQGKKVFAQACIACHRIDGVGVNVGPDISDTRDKTPESILTSILNPNAAIDAAFLQYSAVTADGRIVDGLLIDDRTEGVTLRKQGGESIFIARSELEGLRASGTSFMPDGFERLINESDMANLLAYLKNWRYQK